MVTEVIDSPNAAEADLSYNPFDRIPGYLIAANNHNIAADTWSISDYVLGGTGIVGGAAAGAFAGSVIPGVGTLVGGALGALVGGSALLNEGKFAAASLFSGAASFYNTAVEVSNWFGADNEKLDVAAKLTEFDSNLGLYYESKRESADLVGFGFGSLIPTVGTLKVYNYGAAALRGAKAGEVGANFSSATGLLGTRQAKYLDAAIQDMGMADTPMKLLNANMLKAFGTGIAEEAIQGAFVSTVILSSMHASPILEAMDAGDMAWNIVEGALVGGVLGGLIRGAGIHGNVKTGIAELKAKATPFSYGESLPEGSPLDSKILNTLNNKYSMPEVQDLDTPTGVYAVRKKSETLRRYEDDIRNYSTELAGKDTELGLKFADATASLTDISAAESHILGIKNISRVGVRTADEIAFDKATKKLAKEADFITDAEADTLTYTNRSFIKFHGEEAGAVTHEAPSIISFADRLKPGVKIEVSANEVSAGGVGKWRFSASEKAPRWNGIIASADEWEARNIWAASKDGPTITAESRIHVSDLPLLRKAINNNIFPTLVAKDGSSYLSTSKQQLIEQLELSIKEYRDTWSDLKSAIPRKLGDKKNQYYIDNVDMAKRLDVTVGYLEGTGIDAANSMRNISALRTAAEDYTARMKATGRIGANASLIETWTQPQYGKIITDTKPLKDIDNNVMLGMAAVKERARLQQQSLDNAVNQAIGTDAFAQLPTFSDRAISAALAEGGPGIRFLKTANNPYGSLGSAFQQIGAATNRVSKMFIDKTNDYLTAPFAAMKSDAQASLQWSALQTRLRATPEVYYHDHDAGELVLRGVWKNERAVERGEKPQIYERIDPKAAERIPIDSEIVNDAFRAHISRNNERVTSSNNLKRASGYPSSRDPLAAYPLPVNQRDYPHFAWVVNDTVTGTGHVSTIYAASAAELELLINKVSAMPQKLTVIRKDEVERNKKALQQYIKDDTITENDINTALFRSGASANFIPKTDPIKIVDDAIDWHLNQDRQLARYAISAKYSKVFDELNRLGESYAGLQTSRVGAKSLAAHIETKVQNPMVDYIKTALNMTSTNETPQWTAINNFAETKFTSLYRAVKNVWADKYTAEQADKVNAVFEAAGIKTAMYDATLMAHANHTAPVGDLTKFVSRANGVLATLQLRMDPTNAAVNMLSSNILAMPEIMRVLKGIEKKNPLAAGELTKINLIGTSDSINAPSKLYANAVKRFFTDPEAKQWAKDNGFMTRHLSEYQSILDDATLKGAESVAELALREKSMLSKAGSILTWDKFDKFGNIAEKVTGNKFAEEFNRFVAADMMKQITDVAVSQGVLRPENTLSYINTFVNRTQGNYLASQRPLMFQGAIGQAMGLFQNYQFNMIQQLLRHVSEGQGKNAAMILGMQGTIYGMHGLPGFDYLNNHIIGTMSGNKNNRDLYDATYGIAGKDAGNWLMYGAASNIMGFISPELKANLYTRGDINPRQATIVPLDPAKIPIINASYKFFANLKDTMQKLGAGGDVWPTMMQGIEHAGINRPLQGLAQTLEALGNPQMQSYGTSGKGNVTMANDLFSLANLTRLAGAKPLDEAVAIDAAFRLDAYKTIDSKRRENLGKAIKTSVMAGNVPTSEQIEAFSAAYVKNGGQQKEFNQFMVKQMKNANTSHANSIADSLSSPHAQSMQRMMDGYDLKDFSNSNN